MRTRLVWAVALGAMVLLGGCAAPGSTGTTPSPGSPTGTAPPGGSPTPTGTAPPTASPTPTPTVTPSPVTSLPSTSGCLADAVPRPDPVDGVEPSAYPEPPADVTRASLVNWTKAFEMAYFHNLILADVPEDDDRNLTDVSAYAEVRAVNRTASGYVVRFSDSGATTYASHLHGDHWMDVGYVVNGTHVVRVPLSDRDDPVRPGEGTVVVTCP